jgi:ribosomal protein S27AE
MANDRISKSPYARAKRFMLLVVLSMFLIIWGIPLIARTLGVWGGETILGLIGPLSIVWLLAGGIGSFLIACPRCGKSLFMRGFWSVPWPARECSRCGNDLTAPHRSERKA